MVSRRYEEAKIGDVFGPYVVTETLPRENARRSDERVRWRCTCGRVGESYVFNLRKAKATCVHVDAMGVVTKFGMRYRRMG